eukprot:TRINITY_DN18780_c0_g1_i1.p1 TRINITY_DN18780_c0_g1~~TRINITY_DN18780_c0_g1_i1.p1  ORF type:complete len:147 (-),score=40.40 TRINITY_DN18780_c0_g1_i1:65-481(-)
MGTIVSLTQQVAEKDRMIAQLREELEERDLSNNNGEDKENDKLNRVLSLVEQIKKEAPEEFRSKLESVLTIGRESWSSRPNYQDGDWIHVDLDTTVSNNNSDDSSDHEDSGARWDSWQSFQMLKLSPSSRSWALFCRE